MTIVKVLNNVKPDIVMYHGLLAPGFKTLALWTRVKKIPAILHIDSWHGDKPRTSWKQKLKGIVYRFFYEAAFAAGRRCRDYLISLGFPPDRIWLGCDVVDNDYFARSAEHVRLNPNLREKEGLPEKYFLCVARYSWQKDHATLLKAYRKYLDMEGTWKLVLIGDGPLKNSIEELITMLNLENYVIQKGWIGYDRIPIYYAFSECLILPSVSESWGLVANEAAACGLPLILSDKCGCVPELCHHDVNGFVFRTGDYEELAKYMLKMSSGEIDLEAFGKKSKVLVSNLSPENWASTVLEIVEFLKA